MSFICYAYYLIGAVILLSALVVASSANPILRIAYLIATFLGGSLLMILLDFYFLGLTYIIVYVGAIMILFLFVIMMVQISDPIGVNQASAWSPRATVTGAAAPVAATASTYATGATLNLTAAPVAVTTNPDGRLISLALASTLNHVPASHASLVASVASTTPALPSRTPSLLGWRGLALGAASGAAVIGITAPVNGPVLYFYPAWSIEFHTLTDLQTFANLLYVGYSVALLLIGVTLWVTMIGIIKVTTSGGA